MLAHLTGLLSLEEAAQALAELSTAPFVDGASTALGAARHQKKNLQLPPEHPTARKWAATLRERLLASEAFARVAWPSHFLNVRFCRYDEGMHYGPHVDLPTMAEAGGRELRTDLSMTCFLTPLADYDGGALVLHDDTGTRKLRGAPGDTVIYPSSLIHHVEPVTRGTRIVGITWIESRIKSAVDRKLLFEMGRALASLEQRLKADAASATDLLQLRSCFYDLTRRFLD